MNQKECLAAIMHPSKISLLFRFFLGATLLLVVAAGLLFVVVWHRDPPASPIGGRLHHGEPLMIGDPVFYEVELRLPWFRWPLGPIMLEGGGDGVFTVDSRPPTLVGLGPGTWRWRLQLVFQSYSAGPHHELRAIIPLVSRRDQSEDRVALPLPPFTVVPPAGIVPGQPLALAPELPMPAPKETSPWTLPGLIVVGLVTMAMVLSALFGPKPRQPPPTIPVSSGETALRELFNLTRQPWQQADGFFVRLTDILKDYLAQRFDLDVRSASRQEVMAILEHEQWFADQHRQTVAACLDLSEQVKFGGARVDRQDMRQTLNSVRRVIAETMPL